MAATLQEPARGIQLVASNVLSVPGCQPVKPSKPRSPAPRGENSPLRLIGYARVSTARQAQEGVSLDAQESRLRDYCAVYGHDLLRVERDEGESASTLERPALSRALEAIGSGQADGLLVLKLDRLTRSVSDLARLLDFFKEDGRALLSVSDYINTATAAGRMTLNILASVSQWEREAIGERTAFALAQVKSDGGKIGALPYGERRRDERDAAERRIVEPSAEELRAVELIRSLWARGASLAAIAQELRACGVRPRHGGASWAPSVISGVIARGAADLARAPLEHEASLRVALPAVAPSANSGGALRRRISAKKQARDALSLALSGWMPAPALPLARVDLVLWAPSSARWRDADNTAARAKPLRDAVARWLGCDDAEGRGVDEWRPLRRAAAPGEGAGVSVVLYPRVIS